MKLSAQVGSAVHEIVVEREDSIYRIEVDGEVYEVEAQKLEADFYTMLLRGRSYEVSVERKGDGYEVRHGAAWKRVGFSDPSRRARDGQSKSAGPAQVTSLMPGKVVRVMVEPGDAVEEGQGLAVVEAMKMENEIASPKAGRIVSVAVEPGQAVERGSVLIVVE